MLRVQKRLAAQMLKCGQNRVVFDPDNLKEIKKAITKGSIRSLIKKGIISKKRMLSTSKFWVRKRKKQKSKGLQKGHGSRKGRKTARLNPKRAWINKIRLQREHIQILIKKDMITTADYHDLYKKSKGGFFRSLRHLKLYIKEKELIKQ